MQFYALRSAYLGPKVSENVHLSINRDSIKTISNEGSLTSHLLLRTNHKSMEISNFTNTKGRHRSKSPFQMGIKMVILWFYANLSKEIEPLADNNKTDASQ